VKYRVGLTKNVGSDVEAWVFDLPGCWTVAPDVASIGPLLPVLIAEHLAWLRRHGETAGEVSPIEVEVTEGVDARREAEFCFTADRAPVTAEEIETAIRRMGFARQELLDLVGELPDLVLDWRPPVSAAARIDSWAPQIRNIREILNHIASGDRYYRTAFQDEAAPPEPQEEIFDLALQRQRAINHLRLLAAEDCARTFRPRRRLRSEAEEWTVRKALRRYICHERFHTAEIQQRRAWLVLGVPSPGR
jgi:uncharacterized damage-inducible protein DinB